MMQDDSKPISVMVMGSMCTAALSLSKKDQAKFAQGLFKFIATGEDPGFTEADGVVFGVWTAYKKQLQTSRAKSEAGRSGGLKGGKASKRNNPNGRRGKQRSDDTDDTDDGMMQTPPPDDAAIADAFVDRHPKSRDEFCKQNRCTAEEFRAAALAVLAEWRITGWKGTRIRDGSDNHETAHLLAAARIKLERKREQEAKNEIRDNMDRERQRRRGMIHINPKPEDFKEAF